MSALGALRTGMERRPVCCGAGEGGGCDRRWRNGRGLPPNQGAGGQGGTMGRLAPEQRPRARGDRSLRPSNRDRGKEPPVWQSRALFWRQTMPVRNAPRADTPLPRAAKDRPPHHARAQRAEGRHAPPRAAKDRPQRHARAQRAEGRHAPPLAAKDRPQRHARAQRAESRHAPLAPRCGVTPCDRGYPAAR